MTKQIDKLNWQQLLKSGDRIFIGSHAATPTALIDNLISNAIKFSNKAEVVHIEMRKQGGELMLQVVDQAKQASKACLTCLVQWYCKTDRTARV